MKAIILAAGRGSRLGSLTSHQPKCLTQVRGKSLLSRAVSNLREAGIEDIALVTGYRRDLLVPFGLHEFHNAEWASSNMVYSLMHASPWLLSTDCIVSYGDIFYRPSAVGSLMDTDADVALTYDPDWLKLWSQRSDDPLADAETFRLRSDGTVNEIGEKPRSVSEVEGQYMGLLKFSPKGWLQILSGSSDLGIVLRHSSMTETLQMLITKSSLQVVGKPYLDGWGEVDTQADLALYESGGPAWL